MEDQKQNTILLRLMRLYKEFSGIRQVNAESQMFHFWENPTIEVFEGSEELISLETEFGIQIDEDTALDLYNMKLKEAAKCIESMIQEQQGNKLYNSVKAVENLTPAMAKRILCEIWHESYKGRSYITTAIDKIRYVDKLSKTKSASMHSKKSAP